MSSSAVIHPGHHPPVYVLFRCHPPRPSPTSICPVPLSSTQAITHQHMSCSAVTYSCEVWGFHSARDIEQVQLCFCIRILGVKKSTQNYFVYGELGRFPMIIHRYTRIIKYWLKIVTGNKCTFVNALYQDGLRNIEDTQKYSWCRSVRTLLFELGFCDVWYNQGVADIDVFIACFQQRVFDIYKQGWRSRIDESTRASFYRVYKSEFGFSHHLHVVCVKSHRVALSRLIVSNHSLRIETGRWERPPIPRQDRMCNVCHKLGDKYHFLLECLSFQELRKRLIPKYYWNRPSMYKCVDLLRSNNKKVLKNLAKFVFRCLYSNSVWFWYMMGICAIHGKIIE